METCLLAFSGGKDSFLAACRLIAQKYIVRLITFDNGSELMMDNVLHGVRRLQKKFGERMVIWEGFYQTTGIIPVLEERWRQMPVCDIAEDYPMLTSCQVTCLHCQSAMWLAGLAYAAAHGIKWYGTGYKKTDEFCTGLTEWRDMLIAFAHRHDIGVIFPMWEGLPDYERDTEMISQGFQPAVLEPKCTLGCWPKHKLGGEMQDNLMSYFTEVVEPLMGDNFQRLADIFRHITLDASTEENAEVQSFRILRQV